MYFFIYLYIMCHYECKFLTKMCLVMHCISAVKGICSKCFAVEINVCQWKCPNKQIGDLWFFYLFQYAIYFLFLEKII